MPDTTDTEPEFDLASLPVPAVIPLPDGQVVTVPVDKNTALVLRTVMNELGVEFAKRCASYGVNANAIAMPREWRRIVTPAELGITVVQPEAEAEPERDPRVATIEKPKPKPRPRPSTATKRGQR